MWKVSLLVYQHYHHSVHQSHAIQRQTSCCQTRRDCKVAQTEGGVATTDGGGSGGKLAQGRTPQDGVGVDEACRGGAEETGGRVHSKGV